jgi:DNA mismatch endonuclease (patch repair protein)
MQSQVVTTQATSRFDTRTGRPAAFLRSSLLAVGTPRFCSTWAASTEASLLRYRSFVARFTGLRAASSRASRAASGSSRKRDTRPELLLRAAVRAAGLRGYRLVATDLPGKPDLVFRSARVVVFCDGDFWHGRDLDARLARLERGHNAPYWVAKIRGNVERDRRRDAELTSMGWIVLRFWESNIKDEAATIARTIAEVVRRQATRAARGVPLPSA